MTTQHPDTRLAPSLRASATAMALLAALAAAGLTSSASAQTITKANNTTSLNFGASYVGGTAPTIANTLLIDNATTIPNAGTLVANIGTGVTVLGINFTSGPISNTARSFTVGATGTGSLTIGSGGITKADNTSGLTIAAPIVLAANQTWSIGGPTTAANGTGNLAIQNTISDGGFTATVSGLGRLDINGGNTFTIGNGVNLNTASVVVNATNVVVTLGNANQTDSFQIANGRAIGSVLANFGTESSFGDGGTNTAIVLGGNVTNGILEYNGASASSNRTFTFDRRSTSSEIRNSNASSTLTLSGNINNNAGTFTGASAIAFGGAGNITLTGTEQIKDNTNGAGSETTLNKNGTGTLTITGANSNSSATTGTFQGATNVNGGLLVVSGAGSINSTSGINVADGAGFIYDSSTALTKGITLASGARFGGDGQVNTNINIGSGVKFVFDPAKTLDVTGTVILADTFGLDDLVSAAGASVDWSSVGLGTYTLFNSTTSVSYTTISNLDFANRLAVSLDKNAWFEFAGSGSDLQLVVAAIPEPSAFAALAGLAGLGFAACRRRRAG